MADCLLLLTVVILLLLTVYTHLISTDEIVCQAYKPIPILSTGCTKPQWIRQGITVAGTVGNPGSSNTQLSSPSGIFIDQYDNLFVADEGNDRIEKFSLRSEDVGLTIVGGNGRGFALNQLKEPRNVYADSAGTLFITDRGNLRLQRWVPGSLEATTVASGRAYSAHWFQGLSGNKKQSDGIYSSESIRGIGRIMRYPLGDNAPTYATGVGSVDTIPGDLAVDECNNFYVVEPGNGDILKFSSGNPTGEQIASGLITPNSITFDTYGNLYFVERDANRVQRLNVHDGSREVIVGNPEGVDGNDSEHLNKPWSIAFDSERNLYVSDRENHRIQKFTFDKGDLFC